MYINSITWKTQALYMVDKKTRSLIPETNFILYYGIDNYIFNNKYDMHDIRVREEQVEISQFFMDNKGNNNLNKLEYLGIRPRTAWRFFDDTMKKYIDEGRIFKKGNKLKFNSIVEGYKLTNFFQVPAGRGEYPTQKPYKLLERIICLSTI